MKTFKEKLEQILEGNLKDDHYKYMDDVIDMILQELSSRLPEKRDWKKECEEQGLYDQGAGVRWEEIGGYNKLLDQVRQALGLEEKE